MKELSNKAVVISGTPGTGKTTIALELARRLKKLRYVNLSELALKEGLLKSHEPERMTFVVDAERVKARIRELVLSYREGVVIDSHYGELLDDELVEKIIVLRLHPEELLRRLESRGYPPPKIGENVEAELIGVCTYNAVSTHRSGKVCELDVTGKKLDDIVEEAISILKGEKPCRIWVDWTLSVDEALIHKIILLRNTQQGPEGERS
ncbi:MAG: adenylate kinase family protein [Desulfurococcales archaeon]|nr:adenylate kinase family protein [Desulfurococcales archaeon]